MKAPLDGRVAVVTGAAGGLGRVVCDTLRAQGAVVEGADIQGDGVLQLDLATAAGNQKMVSEVLGRHGRLDILVLNAGVQHVAPIAEFPEDEWDRLFDVMVKGPFVAIQAAWPALIAARGGRVLVTASTSSFVAEPFKAAYVAAKHAVLGLVKVTALEGAEHAVTANAVAPGWMRTPLVENQLAKRMELYGLTRAEAIAQIVTDHPVKRFVEPQEVADALAFLASPAASAISGATVPVDLGSLA